MDFLKIAERRYSCRKYDEQREVEQEKIAAVLEAARIAPSACNGQPYHITVCRGETARKVAKATQGMGMNKFATEAPIMLVISEMPYVATAALGARLKKNDYRSIDIGIVSAYITAQAVCEGLDTCMLGWFDSDKICEICSVAGPVRLVVALGYAREEYSLHSKKRKSENELFTFIE